MAALLSHSEGGAAGQTSQLTPHALPLQSVICHPQRELQDTYRIISFIIKYNQCFKITIYGQYLTLSSVETPLSVSFRELHGNWPVTLYRFSVKLHKAKKPKMFNIHLTLLLCLKLKSAIES